MTKLLVRTAYINGMHWADGDGFCPLWDDAERTYMKAHRFLEKHAKPILEQQINPFPWIQEGIISAPAAVSCYSFLECIVGNHFRPYGGGVQHRMIVGGREEEYQRITHVINILHYESGWFRWPNTYLHVEEDRMIDFPLDAGDIVQALPYFTKCLKE